MKNYVCLSGRLGTDPEFKEVNKTTVCKLNLATKKTWKDENGIKKEHTEWHNVSVWGKLGENSNKFLKKGSLVSVEGEINYKKVEGQKGYYVDIRANNVLFLDPVPTEF